MHKVGFYYTCLRTVIIDKFGSHNSIYEGLSLLGYATVQLQTWIISHKCCVVSIMNL
jgi:hypothetical protein